MKNKDIPEGGALTCLRCRGVRRSSATAGLAHRVGGKAIATALSWRRSVPMGLGAKGVCMIDTIGMNANQKNFTVPLAHSTSSSTSSSRLLLPEHCRRTACIFVRAFPRVRANACHFHLTQRRKLVRARVGLSA